MPYKAFDVVTCQELKAYVYMLVDPDTKKPFYIGKGNNNRVFEHVENVRSGKVKTEPKNDEILRILGSGKEVEHIIVHHGLDDETALLVEASLIDAFNHYSGTRLTNLVSGHDIEHGIMSDVDIIGKYSSEFVPYLEEGCVVICINRLYRSGMTIDEIWDVTKESWRIDKNKVSAISTVLSVYEGLVVGVFTVEKEKDETVIEIKEEGSDKTIKRIRYSFRGQIASETMLDKYLGKLVPQVGNGWPLNYADTINQALDDIHTMK